MTIDSINLDELPAVDDETRRDRWGRYLVVPPEGGQPVGYTRASTIAKVLDSGGGLMNWKATMAITGLLLRPGLRAQWEALLAQEDGDPWYNSEEGKKACKALVEDCASVGGSRDRAQIGTALHAITAMIDAGRKPQLMDGTARDVAAYQAGLAERGITLVPGAIELTVVLDNYQVGGMFDRLARVRNRELPLIADLKTGASLDYSWQSFAVQLAIYSRANAIYRQGGSLDGSEDQRVPMPAVDQDMGLIFWLNAGTAKLEVYEVDLNAGWEAFTHSMWTRSWRNKKVSTSFSPATNLEEQLEASLRVVATAQSRRGGRLDCGHVAKPGEDIFKVDTGERGSTTSAGNGLGGWVCMPCAHGQPAPEVEQAKADHPSSPQWDNWDLSDIKPAADLMELSMQSVAASQLPATSSDDTQNRNDPDVMQGLPAPGTSGSAAADEVAYNKQRIRDWLQGRIDAVGQHPQARLTLGLSWPADTPALKKSDAHTPEQIYAIEKLLDGVERQYELPFGPPHPGQEPAVAKILDLFPGSAIQPTNQPEA